MLVGMFLWPAGGGLASPPQDPAKYEIFDCTSAKNHGRRRRSIKEVETEEEVTF